MKTISCCCHVHFAGMFTMTIKIEQERQNILYRFSESFKSETKMITPFIEINFSESRETDQ